MTATRQDRNEQDARDVRGVVAVAGSRRSAPRGAGGVVRAMSAAGRADRIEAVLRERYAAAGSELERLAAATDCVRAARRSLEPTASRPGVDVEGADRVIAEATRALLHTATVLLDQRRRTEPAPPRTRGDHDGQGFEDDDRRTGRRQQR